MLPDMLQAADNFGRDSFLIEDGFTTGWDRGYCVKSFLLLALWEIGLRKIMFDLFDPPKKMKIFANFSIRKYKIRNDFSWLDKLIDYFKYIVS